MPRFDLLDEYTNVFLSGNSRLGASRERTPPEFIAPNRRTNGPWGYWMAAAGGFAALVIAVVGSRLPG
jgi:hypothetical protein